MSEENEMKWRLIKVLEAYWTDFCYHNRDICTYCWTDWIKHEPCIFHKRLLIMEDNKVKVYRIARVKRS